MDQSELFREKSIEEYRNRWLGKIIVVTPIATNLTALICIAVIVTVCAIVYTVSYTHRVHLEGQIVPSRGLISVAAPISGFLGEAYVGEGDHVFEGQLLYSLQSESRTQSGETRSAVASAFKRQRENLETERSKKQITATASKKSLEDKILMLENSIEYAAMGITISTEYVELLRDDSKKYQDLLEKHIVTAREATLRRDTFMQEQMKLVAAMQELIIKKQTINELKSDLASFDANLQISISEINAQIARVDAEASETAARLEAEVVAPTAGTVTAASLKAGQHAVAGSTLVSILPDGSRMQVHLFANSRAITFIHPGARVSLRYVGFPYQKFGVYRGVVAEVTRAALSSEDLRNVPSSSNVNQTAEIYRVTVDPERDSVTAYGKSEQLIAGMRVEADVFADSRPLYEWILEPLITWHASIAGPLEGKSQ